MDNLILTGWGWKEYAVSAAVTLRALNGQADVMGMSKRRLPEFLELEGHGWKHIYLIGLSLGGDEERLVSALKSLKRTKVTWVSALPMSDEQERLIAPLLDVRKVDGELPLEAQGVLLRVLEEGRFMRVGGMSTACLRNTPATSRKRPPRST